MTSMRCRPALLTLAVVLTGTALLPRAAGAQRYIAFGDSITEGVGDTKKLGGYPARLQTLLTERGQNALVINSGLPGETTAGGHVKHLTMSRSSIGQ